MCKIGIISSLTIWENSPVKSSGSEIFFVGRFLILNIISLTDIGLRNFISFLSDLLIRVFQGVCSLHLGRWIYWHNIGYDITLLTFYVSRVSNDASLSLLTLVIYIFSLLLKIYKCYHVFQWAKFWPCWLFLFHWFLLFIFSFFLLTLYLICFSFSSS